jgi:hypothetical protein
MYRKQGANLRKYPFIFLVIVVTLAGCALPAGLTAKLPFLNRLQRIVHSCGL